MMPYHVSWVKDGRVRRFAYPHTDLKTAIGFAAEVLRQELECSDVWVSDENGHKIADQKAVAEYVKEIGYVEEDIDEN
jgi:hypothetical protein